MIYRLSKDGSPLFESKDKQEFLDLCVDYYNEVSDDTWEKYEDPSELPGIFEKHGYVYEEIQEQPQDKAYTDMLMLYYEVAKWNYGCNFGDATKVLQVVQQLLINYNTEVLAYLADENEDKSLLQHIVGDDGLKQWDFFKGFYRTYGVQIF